MAAFVGSAGHLVIVFERHHQHGVGVVLELHQVRHTADRGAVVRRRDGRLVDGAIGRDKAVIGTIEHGAGLLPVVLGPALVLGRKDTAGVVAKGDEGGQPPAHAVRRCRRVGACRHA